MGNILAARAQKASEGELVACFTSLSDQNFAKLSSAFCQAGGDAVEAVRLKAQAALLQKLQAADELLPTLLTAGGTASGTDADLEALRLQAQMILLQKVENGSKDNQAKSKIKAKDP